MKEAVGIPGLKGATEVKKETENGVTENMHKVWHRPKLEGASVVGQG